MLLDLQTQVFGLQPCNSGPASTGLTKHEIKLASSEGKINSTKACHV